MTNDELLGHVRSWVDVLSRGEFDVVFEALGYGVAFDRPGAEAIREDIGRYRSTEYFPGVREFTVTDWRTARGGNPKRVESVTWYQPNETRLVAAVEFDLPLNGKWSDLAASFVLFESDDVPNGYVMGLEDIAAPYSEENESAV